MSESQHIPVLLYPTLDVLAPERGGFFVDGTVGMAGHSFALIERAVQSGNRLSLLGIDKDQEALDLAKERLEIFSNNKNIKVELVKGNFQNLDHFCSEQSTDGILLDLGVSSYQLDNLERGFSFKGGPLDMRMDLDNTVNASTIVNTWPEHKLVILFKNYGEERYASKIAQMIKERRKKEPFWESEDLANLIYSSYPPKQRHGKIHPATKVFQALRIEVNREIDALNDGLLSGLKSLKKDGVMAVISFHSLEDRMVKHTFRRACVDGDYCLINKKPITADEEELKTNPRSRSAKLRAIKRVG